jgi:hypothetical protein
MYKTTATALRANELKDLLYCVSAGKMSGSPFANCVKAKNGVLMIDLSGGDPYVFVLPDTIYSFPPDEIDGVDGQRRAAEHLFNTLSRLGEYNEKRA